MCVEDDGETKAVWAFAEGNREICLLHQGRLNEAVEVQ